MISHVIATFKEETAVRLKAKIADGSIQRQHPDGAEIMASMARAVLTDDGRVQLTETCYCQTPLWHERTSVLDAHFDDISATPVPHHLSLKGDS